jgi:hypothetical protein
MNEPAFTAEAASNLLSLVLFWVGFIIIAWGLLRLVGKLLPSDDGGLTEFKERDRKVRRQSKIRIEAQGICESCTRAPATVTRATMRMCFPCSVQWDLNRDD